MVKKKATKKKVEEVNIPKELQNQPDRIKKAYIDWLKIEGEIKSHPDRYHKVTDPENEDIIVDIDLTSNWRYVHRKVSHLPSTEIVELQTMWRAIQVLKQRKGQLKRVWNGALKSTETSTINSRETDILELFGRWMTVDEVHDTVHSDWGIAHISKRDINEFRIKNQEKIDKLRTEWENTYDHNYLAKKRGRIEQLGYLYYTQKQKYDGSDYAATYSREMVKILEQIRKEVEGDRLKLTVDGRIDVDQTIQVNKTLQDVSKELPINDMIIAIVAGKKGLNPVELMGQLTHSTYAAYNGFGGVLAKGDEQDLSVLPSNFTYDWVALEKKFKGREEERVECTPIDITVEVVEDQVKVSASRTKLMEMLEKKDKKINKPK